MLIFLVIKIDKVIDCTQEIIKIKNKQINYYNKNSGKEEQQFYIGEKVLVQDIVKKKWLPAVIKNKTDFPRSYIIQNENGRLVRQNTKFIKKIKDYDRLNEFEDEEDKTKTEDKENKTKFEDEDDEDKKNKK